jgi:hypothetical protein
LTLYTNQYCVSRAKTAKKQWLTSGFR